jgi:hypothetical protein
MTAQFTRPLTRTLLLFALTASGLVAAPLAQAPQVGPNVNIIGGPAKIQKNSDGTYQLLEGDPGQRQNEVSCFVDSRDPLDIGCAYNDYTPVEIAGLNGDGETGDAWIGRSVSTDGGMTWRKYMLPGYPRDGSPEGTNSPLRQLGLDAAADANWIGGPFGVSYLTGIGFKRSAVPTKTTGTGNDSVVFVQKYVNRNNVENDPDPFKPEGPPLILTAGMGLKFHDKPWATVSSLGSLHLVWAVFPQAPSAPTQSEIWHAICPLGDLTRCLRTRISQGDDVFNGATLTIHPTTLWRDITYRRHRSDARGGASDAIMFVRCVPEKLDEDNLLGKCGKPVVIAEPPDLLRSGDGSSIGALFDQGSSTGTFRNLSNPTIAADASKRVYIAWAQRLVGVDNTDPTMPLATRDSRVMLTRGTTDSKGNVSFSAPVPLDSLTDAASRPNGRGHEIRPQMWFGAGKLYVSAAMLYQDQTLSVYDLEQADDPGRPGGKILKYVQSREYKGELDPSPPKSDQIGRTFTEFIVDAVPALPLSDVFPTFVSGLERRHTQEIGLWTGTPPAAGATGFPAFTFSNVWRSRIGLNKTTGRYEQVDFNAWGINMFDKGRIAFAGDYDAVVTQAFVPTALGIGFLPNIALRASEPVYVAWTDNRNVRTYVPPEFFTPAGTPLCSPTNPHAALTRNQDIYMARAGQGLYMYAVGNQKPLGEATLPNFGTFQIKRAYLLQLQNALNATKHYRIVIANQPVGGTASLKQFAQLTELDVSIPPFSIIAREVYVKSADRDATVRVNAFEINQPGGTLVNGGLQASVLLNPDRFSPGLEPPIQGDVDPTDPRNSEIFSPDPLSPDPLSSNVDVTPDPLSPDPLSPDPLSPDPLSPDPLSPDPLSPDPLSPDPLSPDPLSPDPLSPDPLSVPSNGVMTDTVVEVQNDSNTSSAMAIKTLTTRPLPPGSRLQMIILQPYFTTTQRECRLLPENASIPLVTVPDPELVTSVSDLKFDPTNSSVKNITVGTRPGSKIYVVYRWVDPDKSDNVVTVDQFGRRHSVDPDFNPAVDLITVPISQAVSTPEALTIEADGCGGLEQPPCPTSDDPRIPLSITTTGLATNDIGQTYPNTQLTAIGGVPATEGPAYSWSATGLPNGMTLSAGGVLSGPPLQVGVFTVNVTVTDSRTPEPNTATRSFRLTILPRANVVGINTLEDTPFTTSPGDGGGNPITINFTTLPAHGTVSSVAGEGGTQIQYSPAANYFGPDSFVYSITANGLTSNPSTVNVDVAPVNDAPVAQNDTASTTTNLPVNVNVLANDTDVENDALSVTGVGTPTSGIATIGDDLRILYTPATGFTGSDSFPYTISDGNGGTATASVVITVDPGTAAASTALIDCSVAAPSGGDLLERGFYVPSYPGANLRRVDLWLSADTAGSYTFDLTARAATYDGTVLAATQQTVDLNGDILKNTLTTFDFTDGDFAPGVTPGTLVTFSITKVGGPGTVFYSVASPSGCPIKQTNDTSALTPIRRDGVTVRIFGDEPVLLFGVNSNDDGLSVIDPTTGGSTFRGRLGASPEQYTTPVASAVRPSDEILYVWNNGDATPTGGVIPTGVLLAVDPCTGAGTPADAAAPPQGEFGGIAFSPTGVLFGAGLIDGTYRLFRINPDTGIKQLVSDAPSLGFTVAGLAFNSAGTLYALPLNDNNQSLYTIDTTTGVPTKVADLTIDGAPANVGFGQALTFSPTGTLIGGAGGGTRGNVLFDINPTTAVVSNFRTATPFLPQGMDFAPGCPGALLIRTKSLPTAVQIPDSTYRAVLRAAGGQGSVGWKIVAGTLPEGLSLDPETGVISGPVTATSVSSTFTVEALDQAGHSSTRTFTIVVATP